MSWAASRMFLPMFTPAATAPSEAAAVRRGLPPATEPMTTMLFSTSARSWKAMSFTNSGPRGVMALSTFRPFISFCSASSCFLRSAARSRMTSSTCLRRSALSLIAFCIVPTRSGALLKRPRKPVIMSCNLSICSSTALPVMASIRRTPAATLLSERMRTMPMQPVLLAWHPPQNSTLEPNCMTRTLSPYFSPKRAMAPSFLASSMGVSRYSCRGRF